MQVRTRVPLLPRLTGMVIQCRVCHNIHKRNESTVGPIAFYNSTTSSLSGHAVYEPVSNTTELCVKCHSGASHDSKFAGTHKTSAGFNCTNCHMNSSFNNEKHMFHVKNTSSEVTGCEVCHKASDHTFQFTSNHTGKVDCVACHDQTFTTRTQQAMQYPVTIIWVCGNRHRPVNGQQPRRCPVPRRPGHYIISADQSTVTNAMVPSPYSTVQ